MQIPTKVSVVMSAHLMTGGLGKVSKSVMLSCCTVQQDSMPHGVRPEWTTNFRVWLLPSCPLLTSNIKQAAGVRGSKTRLRAVAQIKFSNILSSSHLLCIINPEDHDNRFWRRFHKFLHKDLAHRLGHTNIIKNNTA